MKAKKLFSIFAAGALLTQSGGSFDVRAGFPDGTAAQSASQEVQKMDPWHHRSNSFSEIKTNLKLILGDFPCDAPKVNSLYKDWAIRDIERISKASLEQDDELRELVKLVTDRVINYRG
jgi:hypothetical protein